jgi:CheY-like chemotaxis protein
METNNTQDRIGQLEGEIIRLKAKLSEQHSIEEQLRKAQKMEALATLASGVAHDFNNILQTILGYTQLALLNGNGSTPVLQSFTEIENIVKKGAELTKKFITFGNKDDYRLTSLDINKNIQGIEKLLTRTFPKTIKIETALSEDLKKVKADSNQIDQVIMNICINSRDSMPDGGKITLTTENFQIQNSQSDAPREIPPGEYVLVTVSDSASGLSANMLPDSYQTSFPPGGGSGLGLSMAYSIIKDFEGYIDFSTISGQGGIFKIYFPALHPYDSKPQSVNHHIPTARERERGDATVLLVDDEPYILKLGKLTLEKYGYNVGTALSGEEAIEVYLKNKTDLVILDIGMPGMGGMKCIHDLLDIDPDARILVMSGYSSKDYKHNALDAGAKSFLTKPYTIDEILLAVKEALN